MLPLVAIYGTITYYLEHQAEPDTHFRETGDILAAHQPRLRRSIPSSSPRCAPAWPPTAHSMSSARPISHQYERV